MTDHQLELLILMSCEKDFMDTIHLDSIAEKWAALKAQKIKT